MSLASGFRLGPYEIVAPLGAGGMGEVYRAKDTRLGREVAIKVLPAEVASDPERLRRFEQEARAASAIHHPNLLTVFDIGAHDGIAFFVTELLEGQSLRELARRGPVAPKRAVELATQLARGLAAAHDRGIVHRDLKPENLFVTKDGTAKILDFGLAKIELPELAGKNLQDASTVLETSAGTVLGTVGYMAPEQVRGERADAQSDLFSLGVVLHELLAGANPFRRDSVVESLNAILKEEPPELAATPSGTPPALARIVARLLEKAPDRRFRSAHDLVFALEGSIDAPSYGERPAPTVGVPSRVTRRWLLPIAGLAVLASGLAGGMLLSRAATPAARLPIRFQITPPENASFRFRPETHNLALAPDGRTLAYVAGIGGRSSIQLRDFTRVEPRELAGTQGAQSPFWSPDGRSLAFFADGKLKRVGRDGGPVQVICDARGSTTGAWGSRGTIVFTQVFGDDDGLFRVASGGGTPTRLVSAGEGARWIDFLPDGRRFLYFAGAVYAQTGKVYVGDLDRGASTLLLDGSSQARYATPGWLLFVRSGALVAQRFDARSARLSGDPIPVASDVPHLFNGWSAFTVAGAGALAYQASPASSPLVWLDRYGREIGRVGPFGRYFAARLSSDGKRAAATLSDPITTFTDVWIVDLERGGATRLTENPYLDWAPVWSPDGQNVAYTEAIPGTGGESTFTIRVRRAADGADVIRLPPRASFFWPRGWSARGMFIDAVEPKTSGDLWHWLAPEGGDSEPQPILQTEFREEYASPSPEGRWLAFYSEESGEGEIALARTESPKRRIRVSQGALRFVPRWRGDGRELFYVSAAGWLTAIPVGGSDEPELGEPEPLFEVELPWEDSFDVSADGQRFLVADTRPTSALPITVVLDWQANLPDR